MRVCSGAAGQELSGRIEQRMASFRERYENLVAEYGGVAISLWFGLFFTTWFVCWLGVKGGLWPAAWVPDGSGEPDGILSGLVLNFGPQVFVAYLMTQLTKPVRFIVVLASTPIVARWIGRAPTEVESVEEAARPAEQPGT